MLADTKSDRLTRRLLPWILALGVTAIVTGLIGFHMAYDGVPDGWKEGDKGDFWDVIFGTLQLFVFNPPGWTGQNPWLNVARFCAFLATITAGIAAIYALFSEQIDGWRVRRWRNHVIVCGLGYKGYTFVQRLKEAGYKVVAIEASSDNPTIDDCRNMRVPVIVGDAQHEPVLRQAGVGRAEWLLSVCPDDAVNAEIMLSARGLVGGQNRRTLRCLSQISDARLCGVLQTAQLHRGSQSWTASFFNTDDAAATLMLNQYPVIPEVGSPPHLLVAHLDSLGQRLLVLAAQRWLTQRARAGAPDVPIYVTVIDDDAIRRLEILAQQHPMFKDPNKIQLYTSTLSPDAVGDLTVRYDADGVPVPGRAFVAAKRDEDNVATALMLRHHLNLPMKIVAALSRSQGTGKLLDSLQDVHVAVFSTFEATCTADLLFTVSVEDLAKEIHAIWVEEEMPRVTRKRAALDAALAVVQRALTGDSPPGTVDELRARLEGTDELAVVDQALTALSKTREGDGGSPSVDDVVARMEKTLADLKDPPDWDDDRAAIYRPSCMAQAQDIPVKLRSLDCAIKPLDDGTPSDFAFTVAEVEKLAVDEHDRWNSERFNAGWTLAEEKDPDKLQSPYLIPFEALPADIAEYDRVFVRTIPRILQRAGLKAVRNPKADPNRRTPAV